MHVFNVFYKSENMFYVFHLQISVLNIYVPNVAVQWTVSAFSKLS